MRRPLRPWLLLLPLALAPLPASASHGVSGADPAGDQQGDGRATLCRDPAFDLIALHATHDAPNDALDVRALVADASAGPACATLDAARGDHSILLMVRPEGSLRAGVGVYQGRIASRDLRCLFVSDDFISTGACRYVEPGDDPYAARLPLAGTFVGPRATVVWDYTGLRVRVHAETEVEASLDPLVRETLRDHAVLPAFVV